MMENCKEQIKNKPLSMALGGWSNVHNEHVVCVSVTSDGNTYLTDTMDFNNLACTFSQDNNEIKSQFTLYTSSCGGAHAKYQNPSRYRIGRQVKVSSSGYEYINQIQHLITTACTMTYHLTLSQF